MIPTIQTERPPFVRFEERELGIDPEASEKAGRPIPRMGFMACITPHGSRDVIEKIAPEWIADIKKKATLGQYPLEWARHYELQFEEWKKGNELPREGTPVKTWALIAVSEQRTRLIAMGLTTVEDLAAVPDSGLSQIGLDGRYLRDLARGWVNEAKEKGANAVELANAKARITELEGVIDRQETRLKRLEAKLADDDEPDAEPEQAQQPRRGRRRTEEPA